MDIVIMMEVADVVVADSNALGSDGSDGGVMVEVVGGSRLIVDGSNRWLTMVVVIVMIETVSGSGR